MALNFDNIDFDGFDTADDVQPGPPPALPDPGETARTSLSEAIKKNPDQQAEYRRLSKESGIPTFAVEGDPGAIKTKLKFDSIDFDRLGKESPSTAKFMSDYDKASVAHDDLSVLERIEKWIKSPFENIGATTAIGFKAGAEGTVLAGADRSANRIADLIPFGAMPPGMEAEALDFSRQMASNLGIETDEQLQAAKQESIDLMIGNIQKLKDERQALTPEDLDLVQQGIRAGIESIAQNAPGFGLMLLSGGRAAPALATMGVQTFGASYGEGRSEGLTSDEAAWYGLIDSAIEVGTEILPVKTLEKILTGKSQGLKKDALKFLVREMGTEQLATLGQTINAYGFGLDEELANATDPAEMVRIQLERQFVTAVATVVAGGAQATAATGIRKSVEMLTQHQQRTESVTEIEQRKIDELNETVQEANLKTRDKDLLKQFVTEADGDQNTNIFIDGAQVALYLQDKNVDEDPALQLLAAQAREASSLGGDVVVPVGDFAAEIIGSEHYDALRPHMTMSAESVPPFRQEQVRQETQTYVQKLVERAEENVSEYAEAQEIFTTVRDQLIDTGRMSADQASAMAQVVPAWATVYARDNGMTIQEAYEKSGLIIEGPQTGRMAEVTADTLTQEQDSEQRQPEIPSGISPESGELVGANKPDWLQLPAVNTRTPRVSIKPRRPESVTAVGVHYGRAAGLKALDPRQAGTASAGQERRRFGTGNFGKRGGTAARTYFYLQEDGSQLPASETVVKGTNTYRVVLDNMYDIQADPLGLRAQAGTNVDMMEELISNAGFDGFISPAVGGGINSPVAVVFDLGDSTIPVEDLKDGKLTGAEADGEGGGAGLFAQSPETHTRHPRREDDGSLQGLPRINGAAVFPRAVDVASRYMAARGLPYNPPHTYASVDVERARRIAQAYEQMEHNPQDPEVKAAYDAMIEETIAQYQAVVDSGLVVEFIKGEDPYGNPRNMTDDVRNNNHMWVFSTRDGFGSNAEFDVSDNPLLQETEFTDANGEPMLVNDLFRVVHDYFGHVKEGVGFRAGGEENAWRAHSAMYSPLARRAMTSETRGQNSWVNYGPHGEVNRTAGPDETVYADQKIGLLPEWVANDGMADRPGQVFLQDSPVQRAQRNELGLYSAMEQALIEMDLPQTWKRDKPASGNEIWNKLRKTPGIKKEELEWSGIEQFLLSGDKFTRDDVLEYVRNNGVTIEETVADQEGGDEFMDLEEISRDIDEDESNWSHNVEDMMSDWDGQENDTIGIDIADWIDEWLEDPRYPNKGVVVESLYPSLAADQKDHIDGLENDDEKFEWLQSEMPEDVETEIRAVARDDFEKAAEESALQMYLDNPIRVINFRAGEEEDLYIVGNEDMGYRLYDGDYNNHNNMVRDDIWSESEAEIQLREIAEEREYLRDPNDISAARWEDYTTPGTYDNYREIKLKLPQIDGSFTEEAHFGDEENIVAFLRVTDRDLSMDTRTEAQKKADEEKADQAFDEAFMRIPDIARELFETEYAEKIPDDFYVIQKKQFWPEYVAENSEEQVNKVLRNWKNATPENRFTYYHQGQLRYAEAQRVDAIVDSPDDLSTYFIDEFQSDWHQHGRKIGYQTGVDVFELDQRSRDLLSEAKQKERELIGLRDDKMGELDQSNPELRRAISELRSLTGNDGLVSAISMIVKGAGVDADQRAEGFEIIKQHPELLEIGEMIDEARKLEDRASAERNGVPDAPFKGEAWMELGLKRAIIDAVDRGYDAIAWADSNVLSDRWSSNYEELYQNQYDKKLVKIVRKLTAGNPIHMNFDGEPHQHQELGYWIIPITPELKATVKEDAFPLFQGGDQPRGFYDPANSLIRLTESSDLSTFLHEFAHFMYEMEIKAGGPKLNQIHSWFKRNVADVVKEAAEGKDGAVVTEEEVTAYLDSGTTTVPEKDAAIRRAVHEQFARGFETYLMEGRAPSVELRNVFRRFARWLAEVYRTVRGQLNVNLDDEMRQVFDRLLATEEQIEAAAARIRLEPLFTDAAMAGMTDEEFKEYQDRQAKVKDKGAETLREKLIKQMTRQTEKWWKDEKADLVSEITDELRTERVYVARDTLRGDQIKLDRNVVKEMVGEQKTDSLGRTTTRIPGALNNMTAGGGEGVHPDEAAAFFGYNSGEEMVRDLIDAPNIKTAAESEAQKRMIDRHGDILNDGTIEQEADEALQNEERGRMILAELKVLSRGSRTPALERNTLQALAEENIGKLSFRQIHPGKYRRAEIRAAQEAATMMEQGNREGAAAAKARQALNFYLGKAATEARNETMKIVDRMSRYGKKNVREEIMRAGNGYWEQLTKILNRFDFRKSATLAQVDRVNQDINTWMWERIQEDGDGLVLTDAVLNETYVTHWKNVPYSDLQGINDSVRNIEHVARYSNKITRLQEEMDFRQLVDRWVTSMNDKVKTRFKPQRTDVVRGRKWGRWAMAQMTKIPYLASWLDGGERVGLSHDILVQPFNDAYAEELKLWEEVGSKVMNAIADRSKEDLKRHNRKVFIPELKDERNDGNIMGHQILAVALNTGNAGNLKKMLLGEGWANPEFENEISIDNPKLQAVLSRMTKSDWELVQMIWDEMDKLYPLLAEVHQRTTGLTPPKVEAVPVKTPFGTFRGGYYPVKYDPNRSIRAQENEDRLNAETESMFGKVGIQASVNASATNERTGYYAPIRLSLDVVPNHFQETIHYITHHDAVREINKLIKNPTVAATIKEKLGPEEYAQLRPWLNDIAKDGRDTPMKTFWGSALQRLRFGTTLGVMGFKVSTGLIQISGLSNTIAEVGMAPTLRALRSILGSTNTMRDAWEFAAENSKILKNRMTTMDREIRNAMQRLEGKRGVLAAAQEASMKHIALIQTYMVDLPSWHAAYMKAMDDHGDEARAYRYADWVIENIQGSGLTKDMAQIMRNQSEEGRMFTMFMTFFSSLWNMERDLVKGAQSGLYSTSSVAAKSLFLFAVPVLFDMLLRGDLGADEDDEETRLQKYLTQLALYPVQSVPFARDIANGVIGDYGYNITPIAQLLETGTRTIPEVVTRGFTDDEITRGQVKGSVRFIGAAAGVPGVSQAWATGEHLYDVMLDGEDLTARQLIFGPDRD